MSSLSAFLRDYAKFNYSDDEIVDHYESWVKEDKYMILVRWDKEKWANDVFAVKCSKRGDDVYKSRLIYTCHFFLFFNNNIAVS